MTARNSRYEGNLLHEHPAYGIGSVNISNVPLLPSKYVKEEYEMQAETRGTWYQTFIQEENEDSPPTQSTKVEVVFAQSPDAVGRKMILKHAKLLQDTENLSIVVLTGGGTGNYIVRV